MSIKYWVEKIKRETTKDAFLIPALIVLVGFASFGLGRLSLTAGTTPTIRIEQAEWSSQGGASVIGGSTQENGKFVGSANSDIYHFPWCSGAQRISAENEVWFDSKQEAQEAGYRPAENCKGLE